MTSESFSRRGFLAGAGATGLLVAASGGPARAVTTGHRPSASTTVILNGRV